MKRLLLILLGGLLASCSAGRLVTEVSYYSLRNINSSKHDISSLQDIPDNAEIALSTNISVRNGTIGFTIYNLTNLTMTIDRTRSFFISPGNQEAYYNPTVTTRTNTTGSGHGVSVNLGLVSIGGSESSSSSTSTYNIDQQIIHIPPYGHTNLEPKEASYILDGKGYAPDEKNQSYFGVCVAYSTDGLNNIQNFISTFYMNDKIVVPVRHEGRFYYPNEALRKIYAMRPNLFAEKYWWLWFDNYEVGERRNWDWDNGPMYGKPKFDNHTRIYGEFPPLYDYK